LKNVPWDQALDLILANNNLGMREEGNVIWISTKARISQIEAEDKRKIQEFKDEQKRKKDEEKRAQQEAIEKEPLVTEYIGIDFASLDDIKTHVKGVLSDRGKVSSDTRTNMLIITDIASSREAAKELVKRFDAPVKQIMIEARIVDAKDTFIRHLGVQWAQFQHQNKNLGQTDWTNWGTPATVVPADPGEFTPGANLYSPTFTTNAPTDWSPNLGLVFSKLSSFGLTATVLDAKLALAEQEDQVKTLSAPKVIASNGEQADISRGDTLVIAATENVASTTLPATLSLTVTPTVSFNNYVTMEVSVTDDKAESATQLSTKSINTTLMVKSGETFVIGGIKTEIDTKSEQGFPFLRHIPILGWLFKARYKKIEKTELLIFITPTVLPSYTQY
jgi:type IV pilus assembly protein PilQ